ncbi:MAG: hypothetical protein UV73_C0001G0002 [Candidatus Gottesmanbacteria bacterium GW2011_GWA2_43_14]|uniref:Uncharacterized protein n=1 Tax=Candidatus Gottesmanbacteria bacterium GW2011_GWA2_43_14 TaxID=1618443 RepID=A0A0G1FTZ8_9BACT|nr:MAG: hypothetical protein UV73_C0001G0002 [Candidatus Gottesmanbacteria bacterium GW2011_GWA2_43_14]
MFKKSLIIPLALTVVLFLILTAVLRAEIGILNAFTSSDILTKIRWSDLLVGITIYLKTSIDFAIFMGNLMHSNPGWKNRIAIESGTAFGNAVGTIVILAIWTFFKEIDWLLALMIILASLVLLRLAEEGFDHAMVYRGKLGSKFLNIMVLLESALKKVNAVFSPLYAKIIPGTSMKRSKAKNFPHLLKISFSIPFILGLDDFAGYVPLFNIVNVFGFAIGVMLGHTILNIFLFMSPDKTVNAVKNPFISFVGSLAFIALAVWGFYESYLLLFVHSGF